MSPKRNRSTAAKRARAAQQDNPEIPYTELLRAEQAAGSAPAGKPDQAPATPTTGGTRMSLAWSPTTLVRIDYDYDRANADHAGGSRYAAYVRMKGEAFNYWGDESDLDPARFAGEAWRIATGPVMSPGFVRIRPDLTSVRVYRDDYEGALAVAVSMPLSHGHLVGADRWPYDWQDWERERFSADDEFRGRETPDLVQDKVAVLTNTTVRLTLPKAHLHVPTTLSGPGLVMDATTAVETLVELVNQHAGSAVARVLGQTG
ncbi:hypothetical protein ACIF6L_35005 [Kitasatospora sp. NPDC086009]|uniref:hypothetical protein n=1 Tax=unclassified Kitasatospora TaxID=2633591 RepID=UPI0037C765CA